MKILPCITMSFNIFLQVRYSVRVKLGGTGEIKNSDCECPAGAGPHSSCKHVAAMALMIQQFVETGNLETQKSCTEELQTFHKPGKAYHGRLKGLSQNVITNINRPPKPSPGWLLLPRELPSKCERTSCCCCCSDTS